MSGETCYDNSLYEPQLDGWKLREIQLFLIGIMCLERWRQYASCGKPLLMHVVFNIEM
jgi:hypothetical protein